MKNIIVKASGDVLDDSKFTEFVKNKARNNEVVVVCGGGTQISNALVKAGHKVKYDNFGRVIKTQKEKDIVKNILGKQRKALGQIVVSKNVAIVLPILKAGTIECQINGDNLVKAYYLGFDNIYVFTLKNRVTDKIKTFKDYPKVKIIGI